MIIIRIIIPLCASFRNCIGQEFARNEELAVMAMVLRNFEIFLDEDNPPIKNFGIVLRPSPGLFLKLKCRDLYSSTI